MRVTVYDVLKILALGMSEKTKPRAVCKSTN